MGGSESRGGLCSSARSVSARKSLSEGQFPLPNRVIDLPPELTGELHSVRPGQRVPSHGSAS